MDANFEILELVKFLVTAMADLKLQLLERIVQSRSSAQPDSNLPGETTELHKKIICQAVEDRICKRRDLATVQISPSDRPQMHFASLLRLFEGAVCRPIFRPRKLRF